VNFGKHKKTLEDFLQTVDFIYSGDVISSTDLNFCRELDHSSFSAILFRDLMIDVYQHSFDIMINKSKEIIIHRDNFLDIYKLMDEISINPKILFYSNSSNMNLNLGGKFLEDDDGHSYLPNYFSRRFKLLSNNREVSAYYSPLIKDSIDDCHFYLIDRPIQSMVWSIQNMSYSVNKKNKINEHNLILPIYECDYNSYKIRVVNTQKLRNDKINSLLDGN